MHGNPYISAARSRSTIATLLSMHHTYQWKDYQTATWMRKRRRRSNHSSRIRCRNGRRYNSSAPCGKTACSSRGINAYSHTYEQIDMRFRLHQRIHITKTTLHPGARTHIHVYTCIQATHIYTHTYTHTHTLRHTPSDTRPRGETKQRRPSERIVICAIGKPMCLKPLSCSFPVHV